MDTYKKQAIPWLLSLSKWSDHEIDYKDDGRGCCTNTTKFVFTTRSVCLCLIMGIGMFILIVIAFVQRWQQ